MSSIRSVLVALSLALPTVAAAQDAGKDSTPFHAGQWAAAFSGGLSFASLGVLRFSSRSRALLLDFRVSGGHSHNTARLNDTLVTEGFTSDATIDTRVGRRFYQGRGKSVASFQTVGVLGGFRHACQGGTSGSGFCDNGWDAGAFAELGGAYLITPRFSVGGTMSVAFSYSRSTARGSSGTSKSWAYQGSVQGISLAATVYF